MATEGPSTTVPRPPKVLLVGYNGANNTGSEARLLSIIEDVRSVFGPSAIITVPTLNEANLRRRVVEEKYASSISSMYTSTGGHEDAWYVGWEEGA